MTQEPEPTGDRPQERATTRFQAFGVPSIMPPGPECPGISEGPLFVPDVHEAVRCRPTPMAVLKGGVQVSPKGSPAP